MSGPPDVKITGADVSAVLEAGKGRCEYCRSLAVENRPSAPNGSRVLGSGRATDRLARSPPDEV